MYYLKVALLLSLSLLSFRAQSAILDSHGYLDQVDQLLGSHSLHEAFHPGDEAQIEFSDCSKLGCSRTVSRAQVAAYGDHYRINLYDAAGTLFSQDEVTEAAWNDNRRNLVRAKLRSLESFGFNLEIVDFRKAEGAGEYLLKIKGVNAINQKNECEFLIRETSVGLGQILIYTQVDKGLFERKITQSVKDLKRQNLITKRSSSY